MTGYPTLNSTDLKKIDQLIQSNKNTTVQSSYFYSPEENQEPQPMLYAIVSHPLTNLSNKDKSEESQQAAGDKINSQDVTKQNQSDSLTNTDEPQDIRQKPEGGGEEPNDFVKESMQDSEYGQSILENSNKKLTESTDKENKDLKTSTELENQSAENETPEGPDNTQDSNEVEKVGIEPEVKHKLNIGAYIVENFNVYNKTFWSGMALFNKGYSWVTGAPQKENTKHQEALVDNTTMQYALTGTYMLSSLYSVKSFLGAIEGDKNLSLVTKPGFAIPMASAAMYAAKNHLFDANSIGSTVLEYISSPLTHLGFNMFLNASFLPTYKMAAIPFGISILKSATSEYMPTVSHGLEILQGGFNTYNIWDYTSPEARIIKATEMLKTAYSAADIIMPLYHPTLPQGNEKLKLILSERIEHFTKNLSNISKENVLEDSFLSLNKTYAQAKNISIGNKKFASEEINLYTSIRKACKDKVEFSKVDSCIDGQYDKLIHTFAETNQIFHESEA